MTKVAWIGLGVMGYPMAGHLAKAGHDVTVFNRSAAKAEAWVKQFDGTSATTPAEAAKGANIVFSCVGADDDLCVPVKCPRWKSLSCLGGPSLKTVTSMPRWQLSEATYPSARG